MTMNKTIIALAFALAMTAGTKTERAAAHDHAASTLYAVDPEHSQAHFGYSHFGFSNILGRFDSVSGSIQFDQADPSRSLVEIDIRTESVSTGVERLDQKLRGERFFDTQGFPLASFRSTRVMADGRVTPGERFRVVGDLTIKGVTREVSADVVLNRAAVHPLKKVDAVGFDVRFTVKASDFGLPAPTADADEVEITMTIEALAP